VSGAVTAGYAFKLAFFTAVETLLTDELSLLVSFGSAGVAGLAYDDIVGVADLQVTQTTGPMGTSRARDEDLVLTVWVSAFKPGDVPDLERQASDRAFDLLGRIEHMVRQSDTTVGGTVMWCALTSYDATGFIDQVRQVAGRTVDIEAKFTARARVTGP